MGKVKIHTLRNFLKNLLVFLVIFCWFFSGWPQIFRFPPEIKEVFADTTAVLRPTADGGNDSSTWRNKAGTSCDTTDCYLEVNESSGSACATSDGDTTYISSGGGGEAQTFDIDESGIPGNSIITQIDVTICHKGEGVGGGGTFQTRVCHNGVCTNSGFIVAVGVNYVETTQQITVNYTKNSSSDIEIGLIDINLFREVRISQVSATVTYTLPTEDTISPDAVTDLALSNPSGSAMTVSWTAPGDDESAGTASSYDLRYSTSAITDANWSTATQVSGEPAPSAAGSGESMTVSGLTEDTTYYFALKTSDEAPNESGLSNVPSLATLALGEEEEEEPPHVGGNGPRRVYFSGQAYPESKIELFRKREEMRAFIPEPIDEYTMLEDGAFEIMQEELIGVKFFFALRAEDKDGRKSGILSFDVDMRREDKLKVEDIFFPPTVGFENTVATKDQKIKIMGYAAPNSKIEIKIDDIIKGESQSDETGYWTFTASAFELDFGEHYTRVRQISQSGIESGFSFPKAFKVSPLDMPEADFNDDNKVNITDWSIFLFRWGSEDETLKPKIDMNNDGNINIADFSIFLKAMKI